MANSKNVDQGWAWVVLGASIFNLFLLGAMTVSIGMFQTQFLEHFDSSTAYTSLVCSLCASFQSLLGPVASLLCQVFGIRAAIMTGGALLSLGLVSASFANTLPQLLVCYGLIAGVGFGMAYTPSAIAVGHYFKEKRVLANGIALSSAGIGMMSCPHLIGWLMDQYGWRFSLTVFGCLVAQMIVSGSLIYPLNDERIRTFKVVCGRSASDDNVNQVAKKNMVMKESQNAGTYFLCCRKRNRRFQSEEENLRTKGIFAIFRKNVFWVFGLHYFLEMLGYSVQIVHFPSYAKSVGVPDVNIPTLFTAYGISLTFSRIAGGIFWNNQKVSTIIVYTIKQILFGILIILMPLFARGFILLIVYQVLFALIYGSSFILVTPILVELFEIDNLATVFGFLLCIGGLGYLIGPTIAGELHDMTSSYSIGFHIGGLMVLLGALVLILIPILKRMATRNEKEQIDKNENEDLLVVENLSMESKGQRAETQC